MLPWVMPQSTQPGPKQAPAPSDNGVRESLHAAMAAMASINEHDGYGSHLLFSDCPRPLKTSKKAPQDA